MPWALRQGPSSFRRTRRRAVLHHGGRHSLPHRTRRRAARCTTTHTPLPSCHDPPTCRCSRHGEEAGPCCHTCVHSSTPKIEVPTAHHHPHSAKPTHHLFKSTQALTPRRSRESSWRRRSPSHRSSSRAHHGRRAGSLGWLRTGCHPRCTRPCSGGLRSRHHGCRTTTALPASRPQEVAINEVQLACIKP